MKNQNPNPCIVIMGAGKGRRMKSSIPKVLCPVADQPLIFHLIDAISEAFPRASTAIIVGFGKDQVVQAVRSHPQFESLDIHFITQAEQNGTAHAVKTAVDSAWGKKMVSEKTPFLVLPGDHPAISAKLLKNAAETLPRAMPMRMVTTELEDPSGYGRIVRRGKKGPVLRVVEDVDATVREKGIREVATSIYLFQAAFLKSALNRVQNKNAQKEFYLPDLVPMAVRAKKKVDVLKWSASAELRGVNDPWELAQAAKTINHRIVKSWALRGVQICDPDTTWIGSRVQLAQDVLIHPGTMLCGETEVGQGSEVGPHVQLKNVSVGEKVEIRAGTVARDSKIGSESKVGPHAHLRPGSQVGESCKIGNFVELKNSKIGDNTSIAHLSYVGDARVGTNVNIGCGFVTCNFDGRVIEGKRKHETVIEDDVFMGSDCQTVAPVRVRRGAYVASGSTITDEVPPDALAIARARQVNKENFAKRLRGQVVDDRPPSSPPEREL